MAQLFFSCGHPMLNAEGYPLAIDLGMPMDAIARELDRHDMRKARYCLACWQASELALAEALYPLLPALEGGSAKKINFAICLRSKALAIADDLIARYKADDSELARLILARNKMIAILDAEFWIKNRGLKALEYAGLQEASGQR
jgi:hypothetical protein